MSAMDKKVNSEPFFWVEDYNDQHFAPVSLKRKPRSKKLEFVGWGSKPLIGFLAAIGKDTSKEISRFDVTDIINNYVSENNLIHPSKKKRIVCDERLQYLFGRKTIGRIKIYDMLETHYAENQEESDDALFYSSEEEDNGLATSQLEKTPCTWRKTYQKKKVCTAPKSCFAAIIPDNFKLLYLKRSLVQELLKDPETFEGKVVGSFVRIKTDPNDYLQKNSHQLLQVTGIKKSSEIGDMGNETLLEVSNAIEGIQINKLSDDAFSEEECEDVRQRVKDGLLKRPTVVELQEKARILHQDITKHWLERELALLQKLIDRANEKGWRKELFEYLERRQLLQTPDEQSRLLREVPEVVADEVESEATAKDLTEDLRQGQVSSPISGAWEASDIPTIDTAAHRTSTVWISFGSDSAANQHTVSAQEQQNQPAQIISQNNSEMLLVNEEKSPKANGNWIERQVINLSDDDDDEEEQSKAPISRIQIAKDQPESLIWHYADPQGDIQGPFSIISLKRWRDADYFPQDFKVWRIGESQKDAVLLNDILHLLFPN